MSQSWGLLGTSLGALGGVLGPLGGLLGRSWGDLGASWTDSDEPKTTCKKKTTYQTSQCSFPLRYAGPFWEPKSSKMGPKTSPNLRRFSRGPKSLLKTVLEASWVHLGPFWRPSCGQKRRFRIGKRSTSEKFTFLMWIGFQNRFWSELGSSWLPKRPKKLPKGPPKTAPNGQKSISKNDQNFDRFSRPTFCRFGPVRRNAVASWGDYRGV